MPERIKDRKSEKTVAVASDRRSLFCVDEVILNKM